MGYTSNLDVQAMHDRCAEAVRLVAPGCLRGYALTFNKYYSRWEGGVADVVVAPQQEVWGLVYDVSTAGLERLDIYEGYPHMYTRFQGIIGTSQGVVTDVWIYTVVNKQDFIPPSQAYVSIMQQAAQRFGFPETYRAFLDGIVTR